MKRSGPDSLSSWLISFACCFINMMLYGMARISGILFVASISRFHVSRQQASFPYTFDNFMRNTSGPLVGFLGHRYGVRAVTTVGCLLGAIGAGACYFAESIAVVTVLWGAIFGLGFGLGSILLPVSINQYFEKHRATASGISFSGACLGSFVLPPIVEILLNNYGLSGTYLFLSGFILNCVPAALLLKKPNFEIKLKPYEYEESETQSIVSGKKVKLYTVENTCQISKISPNGNTKVSDAPSVEDKDEEEYSSGLTFDEKIKRLSTQTLLSDYSIRMSISEPLDVEQIIENSKGRRTVDPKVLEAETLSLSSHTTDEINSEKDDVSENGVRSLSFQYEKQLFPINKARALSSEQIYSYKEKTNFIKDDGHFKYIDKSDIKNGNLENGSDERTNARTKDFFRNTSTQAHDSSESFTYSSYQNNRRSFKPYSGKLEKPSISKKEFSKSVDWSNTYNFKEKHEILPSPQEKDVSLTVQQSSLGSFSIILDPMFILIVITNAIYCFTFVCMVTVIVDFARDLEIAPSKEKYAIMCMSIGDIIGRLSLGWITDRGYMTTTGFAAVCYACQGVVIAGIAWSSGFTSLIILMALYGFSEAGIIVIYPVIIGQYIDHDKQTVAIPSSNFLSGPLCLTVAPLIGYFRDQIGSYDYIFYGLAVLSGACCLSLLLAPYVAKCQTRSRCQTK